MTKRRDLERELRKAGFKKKEGGNHSIFFKGSLKVPVPRHPEIPENTARSIRKQAGLQ